MSKKIIIAFWVLVASFLFVLAEMFVPLVRDNFRGSILFLIPLGLFSALGFVLLFLIIKSGDYNNLYKFLFVSGLSSVAFFPSVLAHNIFYGFAITFQDILILKYVMSFFDVTFFVIAVFVCPLVYLVGTIGGIILLFRKRR